MPQSSCGFATQALLALCGPTIEVDIGFDPSFRPGSTAPIPGITGVQALVDTGATECCIDNLLAASLNLPIVDRRPIAGISGQTTANMYLAQIRIPSLDFTMYGQFAGVDLQAGGQSHSALMGRTFLRYTIMTYNGPSGPVIVVYNPPTPPTP